MSEPPRSPETPAPAFAAPADIARAAAKASKPRAIAAAAPPSAAAAGPSAAKPSAARSLAEYYKDWEQRTRSMHEEAAKVDWSSMDMSRLKASDIGVRLGPMLSEEQFRALRAGQPPRGGR
jgi:hypothetical protein